MNVFKFSKKLHPAFDALKKGDSLDMNLKVRVKSVSDSDIEFTTEKFELGKDQSVRRHPAQVMRDFHVEHAG